jgi:hypothetical protein
LTSGAPQLRPHPALRCELAADGTVPDPYSDLQTRLAFPLRSFHDRKTYTEAKSTFKAAIIEAE